MGDGIKGSKCIFGASGNRTGDGCFANAGRAIENHGSQLTRLDHSGNNFSFTDKMLLTDDLFYCTRTHPIGQWFLLHKQSSKEISVFYHIIYASKNTLKNNRSHFYHSIILNILLEI